MNQNTNPPASQPTALPDKPFSMAERWDAIREPGAEFTTQAFTDFESCHGGRRTVLNCAIPLARAKRLTDFQFPAGTNLNDCLVASGRGRFPSSLADWNYDPQIRAATQLPQMAMLPPQFASLKNSPWFDSPSQATGIGINARHLRYHHNLWQELKPKTLRGLHTTLVFVTPQIGFSLEPHIKLDKAFCYFAALARAYGPAQLFPASYLYPDAQLGLYRNAPAPIFADLLPTTGGVSYPVMDCTPDPWGVIARFDGSDKYYGYPFNQMATSQKDFTITGFVPGTMFLPNGKRVEAHHSESYVYATLDPKLKSELKQDRDTFASTHGLTRGVITHDGLPFQLPVELQSMVFAVILTSWELELGQPGNLTSYSLRTRHAAIRGFNYYQRVEPFYGNFMRLIHAVSKEADFKTYPLSTHLTQAWLGGNLRRSNQRSESENHLGPKLMRSYYHQQLDWMAGVCNLWNHASFRRQANLETLLAPGGLAFHQMRPLLRFDSHLFPCPEQRASFWPDFHADWMQLDRTGQMLRVW
jgi:hypothetical protein